MKVKNWVIIIIILAVVLVVVELGFIYWQRNFATQKQQVNYSKSITDLNLLNNQQPSAEVRPIKPKDGTYFIPPKMNSTGPVIPNPNTTVEWLEPIRLDDQRLVTGFWDEYNQVDEQYYKAIYYQIGTRGNNKVIIADVPGIMMGGSSIFFFEETAAGYIFMVKMSSNNIYGQGESQGYLLSSQIIKADTNTFYFDISGPAKINWQGLKLENNFGYYPSEFFNSYINKNSGNANIKIEKIGTVENGELYRERISRKYNETDPEFYLNNYYLKLLSGFFTFYNPSYDFFVDNNVPIITWNDGSKNQEVYSRNAKMGTCGADGGYTTPAFNIFSDIKPIGITNSGEIIYEFKSADNAIVRYFYNLFGGKVYDYTAGDYAKEITIQEWFLHHPVIIYKNAIGDYIFFTSQKYGVQAECAKPVIYLYPEKPTNVKVRVGANITKSEPLYKNGWQVLAHQDGKIINSDGKVYSSLFWDGTGLGNYPEVKEGIIVRQSDLEKTLWQNLVQLGLNKKESQDFMDFWLPKMPATPYVRLTWFGTEQMNNLAPLYIYPKPDTVIRMFLDFEGLSFDKLRTSKTNLPEQNLCSIPRNGFTVVEWGGLLKK